MYIVLIIGIIVTVGAIWCYIRRRKLSREIEEDFRKNPHFCKPNDDGEDITLIKVFGIGNSFYGKFRHASIGGQESYVTYYCTVIIFLVIPRAAFRVIPTTGTWDTRSSWNVIGSDVVDKREVRCVLYKFYGAILAFGAFYFLILLTVGLLSY